MALLVMIPVAALTYGLMRVGISFNSERMGSIEDEQTLFLADAGLAESLLALRNGGTGNIGSQAAPVYYGRGLVWVEVTEVGNDLLLLHSTAMYEGGRRSVETLAFRKYRDFRGMTIFSAEDLRVESQVFVDSFDSALGSYADQVAKKAGFVADGAIVESNGDIRIDPSVELHGDAYPGPGDTVGVSNSAYTSGSLQPNPSDRVLDPVVVPAIPGSGTLSVTSGGAAGTTLAAGDYDFDAINVGTGATLTITGPARVVVDDMRLDSNTNLVLDSAAGPIEFFVSGDFTQASNSSIDVTGTSATGLTMNFTGGSDQLVELRSNSEFYGAIYAPEATVSIYSNFEVFGAVVANNIVLNANARIHYDEALKRDIADPPEYIVATWSLVGFPVREFLANRSDPFRLVGVAPEDLDLPEEGRELP